jgi:hypothetical protein
VSSSKRASESIDTRAGISTFSLSENDPMTSGSGAELMNEGLVILVLYHVAVALHRAGISRGIPRLLHESLKFYHSAQSILDQVESPWLSVVTESLSECIVGNVTNLLGFTGSAPAA